MSGTGALQRERHRRLLGGPQELGAGASDWLASERLLWCALVALLGAAAALCLYETRGTTLSFDEWEWVLGRRGGSVASFLDPHNGHMSLIPVTIYKTLFVTAGLRHYLPYRLLVTAAHLTCGALVFVYARRRVRGVIALAAAAMILFLGPGWQNFLWPFQIAWLISIAAGVGALILVDRQNRAGDVGASLLLACSLASSGVGLAIAAGLLVDVLGRPTRRHRAWIALAPLGVYGAWWLGYQNAGTTTHAILHAPAFVAKAASATMAGLFGLSGDTVPFGSGSLLRYGPPLAILGTIAVALTLVRAPRRRSPRVFALLAMTLAFWVLAALGRSGLAEPYSSRYLYVGGVLQVLVAAELLRGVALGPAVWLVVVLALAAIASNVRVLGDGGAFERSEAQSTAADLGALDIGRPVAPAGYLAARFPGFGLRLPAAAYYAAADAIGTPAATPAQLRALPEGPRVTADAELVAIHQLRLQPGSVPASRRSCHPLASAAGGAVLSVPAAGFVVQTGASGATIGVRRFATSFQPLGTASGATVARIGADGSAVSWQAQVQSAAPVTVCGL